MRRVAPWLVCALAACGSSADRLAVEDFPAAAADALCDWAVRCQHVPDRDQCERNLDRDQLAVRRSLDAIAGGRMDWDELEAARCIDDVRDAACLVPAFTQLSCRAMTVGLVEEGGACTTSFECIDPKTCVTDFCDEQCCLGTCQPSEPPPALFGSAEVGERCTSHFDCVATAYCETYGRCEDLPTTEGARCLFGCARGDLYCDIEVLTCRRFGAEGEACDPQGIDAPPCDPAWSFCDQTCRPLPGLGEPCDTGDRRCIPSLWCDTGRQVCRARREAGEPCDSDEQCVDQACEAGACAPYRACTTDDSSVDSPDAESRAGDGRGGWAQLWAEQGNHAAR